MGKWVRTGDFNKLLSIIGSQLNRSVVYKYDELTKLELLGYKNSNELQLVFSADIEHCELFLKNCKKRGISDLIQSNLHGIVDMGTIRLISSDLESWKAFLISVNDTIPISPETQEELFSSLGIKKIADMDTFINDKAQLIRDNNFKLALEKTLASEEDEALWKLAAYCQEQQNWQHSIDCYQAFSTQSTYYADANVQFFELSKLCLITQTVG